MEDPRELLLLDMFSAYESGISPSEWRKINSDDARFIRQMKIMKEEKKIRIQNKQSLMNEMGLKGW